MDPITKESFSARFSDKYSKVMPDAFIFAVLLTLLTIVLAYAVTDASTTTIFGGWLTGYGWLMTFGFQVAWLMVMALTLVNAPVVHKGIVSFARQFKSPNSAYVAVFIVSAIACWLNVYAGVVIASIFARTLAEEVEGTHFPMIAGATYSGFITWHNGLSSSVGLVINTPGNKFEKLMGGIISTDHTIFSSMNIVVTIALLVVIGIVFYVIAPKKGTPIKGIRYFMPEGDANSAKANNEANDADKDASDSQNNGFSLARSMEENTVIGKIFGLLVFGYIVYVFGHLGFAKALNLNNLGFAIFGLGLLSYRTPMAYMKAFGKYAGGCAGVLIQFPMFGGIMGIMIKAGLAAVMTDWFISISTATTFPLLSFLSAGLVNVFIPSGGSQWAAQAPVCIPAAQALGVSAPKIAMSIAYGDAWTNMIQPFWMLMFTPVLLANTTLKVRDLMGYCFFTLLVSGVIFALGLLLF